LLDRVNGMIELHGRSKAPILLAIEGYERQSDQFLYAIGRVAGSIEDRLVQPPKAA
jgi:hypothetical protein